MTQREKTGPTAAEWKRRLRIGAAALALLAGAFFVYVNSLGGWINTLGLPPTLDGSTPAAQSGFALLSVQRRHECTDRFGRALQGYQYKDVLEDGEQRGVVGLWIRPGYVPVPLADTPGSVGNSEGNVYTTSDMNSRDRRGRYVIPDASFYQITARTSTGDTVSLPWTIYDTGTSGAQPVLLATLPGGYSSDCKFMDVSITDTQGHTARWRVTGLPEMRHEIAPPVAVTTSVTKSGITMTAHAWREQGGPNQEIAYRLRPILPPNSHQWDVAVTGQWQEWEPYDYDGTNQFLDGWPIQGRGGVFNSGQEWAQGGGIPGMAGEAPYQSASRYVRVSCVLRQYETYDETVTFHNLEIRRAVSNEGDDIFRIPGSRYLAVDHAETATTPSGVAVTLPVQGNLNADGISYGELSLILQFNDNYLPDQLPASPLVQSFHRPITIKTSFEPPFQPGLWSNEPGTRHKFGLEPIIVSLKPFLKAPIHLGRQHNFTVVIHQRVDIQTIPMTFTLPVADTPPPFFQMGYHYPKQPRRT